MAATPLTKREQYTARLAMWISLPWMMDMWLQSMPRAISSPHSLVLMR